jgi:hypothetical protein
MSKSQEERAKRLADALRQNLKRRKAHARVTPLPEPAENDRECHQDYKDGEDRS